MKEDIAALFSNVEAFDVIKHDKDQLFDKKLWKQFAANGLLDFSLSESIDSCFEISSMLLSLETLGYHCRDNGMSFALGAQFLSCILPIYLYGSDHQKQQLLPHLCNGSKIIANAITEKQSGSDVFAMESTAVWTGSKYLIDGLKVYSSNAPISDYVLTYLVTNPDKGMFGGISAFILEKSKGDYTTGPKVSKMGLRSCLMSEVYFDKAEVSTSQLLGKEGGGAIIFNKAMNWERIGLSALHLGTLRRIIEDCISYVTKRKAGGLALSKYQAVSHKIVDLYVELEAIRLLLFDAISNLKTNKSPDLKASTLKLKTSELYKRSTFEILQLYGAAGYTGQSDIERMHRDAIASTLYSGSSEIQKNIIAKRIGL